MLIIVLFLTSCADVPSASRSDQTPTTIVPVTSATASPIPASQTALPDYVERVRNAQYQLGIPDTLRVVQLVDGKFEERTAGSGEFISVSMTDFATRGDLTGDGEDEVAALVTENYGGSGSFVFLVVYADVDGELSFQTSLLVDDRPQSHTLSIDENEIFLDMVTHSVDDPMCCPTLRTTRHFRFIDRQLDMVDYTTFTQDGRPRTITITSPASGSETYSSVQVRGNVAVAPFENNLVYRIFDVGGIELSSGSISVSAKELGGPGTFDAIIPIGTALAGAVIRLEVQDISAADGSLFSMDSVELVVK
jgi:hypothetical protein